MKFTDEHIALLDEYMPIWVRLRDAHYVRNMEGRILETLQRIHNEALHVHFYNLWCNSCVAEMIRILYVNYEQFKAVRNVQQAKPEQTGSDKRNSRNKNA
ncbi:hypothetical protein KTO58_01200 [Chitinophaga pendula]|uniref:hypothetical protein n=1 Tax=Chitinophaga TaxID=79328 RepID=UPI000BAF23A5|nr:MULTISPECIES: hypothetical protein [Chitinophaga]ASZ14521.1 hypothetical protein CK934_28020 [Chitinophaga sp. MD30]UCJ07822.1 hypothetical protein KTO58_01200 [Chitinophaga pendula]